MDSDALTDNITLDSIRETLVNQEDTIIFSLIQRANYPTNSRAYAASPGGTIHGIPGSLAEFVVRQTEAVQAKAGRYENPEEIPFFPENLPPPLVGPENFPQVLYPAAAAVNVKHGQELFLMAVFLSVGVAWALSRRIHYGRFVAEVKFLDAPGEYVPLIRAKDKDGIMKLLTDEKVENMVKKRVKKKAMVFGQEVGNNDTIIEGKYKVDPSVVYHLYSEWEILLTKVVEVDYLLRRLD
ncbi:Chorismate mutase [Dionaea muscipula]